jgi:hypothetical protein
VDDNVFFARRNIFMNSNPRLSALVDADLVMAAEAAVAGGDSPSARQLKVNQAFGRHWMRTWAAE